MSKRIHNTLAEKQRAYRARLTAKTEPRSPPPKAPVKRISRPKRLLQFEDGIRALADEYQSWLSALPENLAKSQTAEQLETAIEQLEEIADALADIEPPRIGR